MKNKKGFTLIELLAVIVILAIIALIAVPIVLNMIESAKKKSAESSAYGYIDAIDYNNGFADVEQEGYTMIPDGEYDVTDPLLANIKMKGTKPTGGEIVIKNMRVESGCLNINGYKLNIISGEVKVSGKGICYEQVAIHFDSNGGSSVADQTKKTDKKIGVLPTSERNNYALVGWFTEKNGGTQINEDTVVSGETTYYAHWQKNAVSIVYHAQGGEAVNSTTIPIGQSIGTLPSTTKTGYTFAGWFTEESGGTQVNGSETLNDDVEYYAHWTANKFTVAYNGNGNTEGSTESVECTYDSSCTLSSNGFTKTGYTFAGWKKNNTGDTLSAGASITNEATSGTITYYAQWTANTFTVAYNGNGSTGGSTSSVECTYDSSCTLSSNGFSKTGYRFTGWKKNNTGDTLQAGASIQNAATSGTVTYYAQWVHAPSVTAVSGATHKGIVYMNPKDLTVACTASNSQIGTGAANASGCMRFYIFDNSGSNYKLILDHNTTATVAYETSGTYKAYANATIKNQVNSDTTGWVGSPRLITGEEIKAITGNTTWNGNSNNYFYFGSNNTTAYSSQTAAQQARQRSYAWLFDYTNSCTSYGCNTADLSTAGYWTSSPVSGDSNYAWRVIRNGNLNYDSVARGNGYGVRPVITLAKSQFAS